MGMNCVSQEWQRQLMFLLCPSSSQSIPRTTGILFNNVLLLQRTRIMSVFFISPAPVPWHYNVKYHCDSWSFYYRSHISTGNFFWAVAHGKTCSIYSADPPEPNIDCIPPQHCPKADATYFIVPPVVVICITTNTTLFVVNLYHFRGAFQDWEENIEVLLENKDWGANRTSNTVGKELAPTWRFLLKFSNYMPSLNKFVFIASVIIRVNNFHSLAHVSNQGSKD